MSSNQKFVDVDVNSLILEKPKANTGGAGKTAWVNRANNLPTRFVSSSEAKLLWPIRPGTADALKPHERLNLEISVNDAEDAKARECDAFFLNKLFDMKSDCFGTSAKQITTVDALKVKYKPLVRDGGETKDGGRYSNSIRMKVDGWTSFVNKVNVSEINKANGEKIKVVKDCEWNDRIVQENDRNGPTDRDTIFYLCVGTNPDTGRTKYTQKVPVQNPDGSVAMKDGKPVMRFVGPQDATQGSQLTVIWQLNKVYITETTGPTASAKHVYIIPAPKKQTKSGLDDIDVVDDLPLLNPEDVKEEIKVEERKVEERKAEDAKPPAKKIKTVALDDF